MPRATIVATSVANAVMAAEILKRSRWFPFLEIGRRSDEKGCRPSDPAADEVGIADEAQAHFQVDAVFHEIRRLLAKQQVERKFRVAVEEGCKPVADVEAQRRR